MATVLHSVPNIAQPVSLGATATVAPWLTETLLMLIVAIVSVAAFTIGYQVG